MRSLLLVVFALAGCAVTDVLDGDIDDADTCCIYYPFEGKIVACVESFLPPELGACVPVRCVTIERNVCYGDSERMTEEPDR